MSGAGGKSEVRFRILAQTRRANHLVAAKQEFRLSSHSRKNISVFQKCKSPYMISHPTPSEGRIMIVAYAGWGMRWTQSSAEDEGAVLRTCQVVWS